MQQRFDVALSEVRQRTHWGHRLDRNWRHLRRSPALRELRGGGHAPDIGAPSLLRTQGSPTHGKTCGARPAAGPAATRFSRHDRADVRPRNPRATDPAIARVLWREPPNTAKSEGSGPI